MKPVKGYLVNVAASIALVAWAQGAAYAQGITRLGPADARSNEEVSAVSGFRELPGGRVLTSDSREKVIRLIDFSSGTSTVVSRLGGGPLEYRTAGPLFDWSADSVAMYDKALSRLLIFAPSGAPARTVELSRHSAVFASSAAGELRFIDTLGNLYVQDESVPIVNQGERVRDSSAIARFGARRSGVDTIAMYKTSGLVQSRGANGTSMNIGAIANPFRVQDAWVGFADGRIAVIRSNPFRVDVVDANLRTSPGTSIPVPLVAVTSADRERIMTDGVSIGGGRSFPVPASALSDLPRLKPTFDYRTAIADPSGFVWVERFRSSADTLPVYDVIGLNGKLVRRLQLPASTRVVGFGREHVYLARRDSNDLQLLTRHRRP